MSLLEVVIALAIFAGSIAAIGQLIATGVRGAVQARLQSQAILRAETKMAEIVAGTTPLTGGGTFPDDPSWTWSVVTSAGAHEGLYAVDVTAAHASASVGGNQSYVLRRFVRDPQIAIDAYTAAQAAAAAAGATGGTSSTGASP